MAKDPLVQRGDPYKKPRHTRETCYNIRGYPEGHPKRHPNGCQNCHQKEFHHANNAHSSSATNSHEGSQPGGTILLPPLTTHQYQQLLFLLNTESQPSTANFAGMIPCLSTTQTPAHSWVIDSGASLHFTPHLSPLMSPMTSHHNKPVCLPDGSNTAITYVS